MLRKSYVEALIHPIYGDEVLEKFGITHRNLLGQGRHSRVYTIDKINVLRVYPKQTSYKYVETLSNFYQNLDTTMVGFETPELKEFGIHNDHIFSVERHLGQTMGFAIASQDRTKLANEYVNIIGQISKLRPQDTSLYGELMGDHLIQTESWGSFLETKSNQMLTAETLERLRSVIPNFDRLHTAWKQHINNLKNPEKQLVHGDIFPDNLMVTEQGDISAVIDFSPMTLIGDPRLDAVNSIQSIEFSYFKETEVETARKQIREKYEITDYILNLYLIYLWLYYASDNREIMRDWCHQNLIRVADLKTFGGSQ